MSRAAGPRPIGQTDSEARVVLFIVTSFWAYGELAIATEFAHRMVGTGYRPLFLIPPTHRKIVAEAGLPHEVLIPGQGKINRIQLRSIRKVHRPALVVLADFLNYDFCERHYGLLRADLDVFECPIGTFDDFAWGRPGSWMDTYGFKAKYEDEVSLNNLSFRLRPCPLNNPLTVSDEPGVFTYPMFDPEERWLDPTVDAATVRAELGVPPGRPLIVVTTATWQQMHAAYPRVKAFVTAATAMLERTLTTLLEHASVVAVGPPVFFRDHPPPNFHPLGQLRPARFRRIAAAADLHISNNIVSVSLHRLALVGIPSVAVFSSLVKSKEQKLHWLEADDPDGGTRPAGTGPGAAAALSPFAAGVIEGVDDLYPVRMYPVGWYHFLRSLLGDNPFTDVIAHCEIFQEERTVETILPLLTDGPARARAEEARQRYLAALRRLPTVATILRELPAATQGVSP